MYISLNHEYKSVCMGCRLFQMAVPSLLTIELNYCCCHESTTLFIFFGLIHSGL